jgi:hypothetical protein
VILRPAKVRFPPISGHSDNAIRYAPVKHGGSHDRILGKFYVEHGIHGARVMARSLQITAGSIDDEEIDTNIEMLKDDLKLAPEK